MKRGKSGGRQPHSKTLSRQRVGHTFRQVLECGCPPPLSLVLICLGLLSFATSQLHAQTATTRLQGIIVRPDGTPETSELPPGIELPPGVQLPPGVNPGKEATAKTNAPASPEEKRLQELLKLQFDRRPTAILEALAKGDATNEVQRFQRDVVAGNWSAVKEFLASLPEKHGPQVFKHVVEAIGKPPSPSPGNPGSPEMPQQPGNRPPPQPVMSPEDVLALSEAAPTDLTEEQVEQLGKLLERGLSRGHFIDPLLAKLEAGTARLGGEDSKKRDLAIKLLIAANRLADAGRLLPPLEPALEHGEIKTIELHARYLIASAKQDTSSAASLRRSWELTQTILAATNSTVKEREQAVTRSLELMPMLAKDSGGNWLQETFKNKPEQGMAILAAVGAQVSQQASSRDVEARRKTLDQQRRVVDALLSVTGDSTASWREALNVLALGWMQEADYSKSRYTLRRNMNQFDPYGNQIYYDGGYPGMQDPNQLQPIPPDQILLTAPSESWRATLDKSVLPRVQILMAELHMKAEEEQKALAYVEAVAAQQPKAALNLANEILRSWARNHDPNPQNQMNRYGPYGMVWYGPGSPYGMNAGGTPLTRAMQVRNLAELSKILEALHKLPIGPLDDKAVVGAFSTAHSQAEVFRVEDIETVFGPMAEMKPETLAELLQTMRQRLAGQWRAPRVQQDAKTKRSDKEIDAEVMRGYELVMKLVQSGLERRPDDWRINLVNGAVLFDSAEFDYGRKVDLAIYVAKRDRAFAAFEKAAALYTGQVSTMGEKEQTPQVFQQWFNATLGASDLAYLTRQTEPDTNRLDKIRIALLALPEGVVERHLTAFGKGLSDSINTLKPELKPRYLRAGIRIVGNHESAAEARKLATYYDDLLQEIVMSVRVDGDPAVGHTKPFGVFVSLRHTDSLGRESGGFGKYLQNQQGMNFGYNPYGTPPVNYREDFEKQVREKFGENFDIVSVTFHEDKVQPRGYGRPGWRETPYAYVLLKAKDGAVDRLPALQLDLDFFDKRGQVVLPVVSQVQMIDARPESTARPVKKIEVLQILDAREAAKGTLGLEIKATGRGLLPELKDLMDVNLPGFKIERLDDKPLVISKMDAEGEEVAPVSERNWVLSLVADSASAPPANFNFPKAKVAGVEMAYKNYSDADLVDVKPEVALAGFSLRHGNGWRWAEGGALLVIVGIAWLWYWRRQKAGHVDEIPAAYVFPPELTPFTVLNLLQRMKADQKLTLNADQRRELGEAIANLQQYFFARPTDTRNGGHDLEQVARRWINCAQPR
jgi:hypothetical protein